MSAEPLVSTIEATTPLERYLLDRLEAAEAKVARVEAWARSVEYLAGDHSAAAMAYGPQKISVQFVVASVRHALSPTREVGGGDPDLPTGARRPHP